MNISVAFSKEINPDFVSRAIMFKDGVDYSHVLIIFEDQDGKSTIFHSVGEGVCLASLSEFMEHHELPHVFNVELTCHAEYFYGYVRGSLGKDYAESQVAAIALGLEADNGDSKMICSELVGIVLTEMCGKTIPGDQDIWRPVHCFNALK